MIERCLKLLLKAVKYNRSLECENFSRIMRKCFFEFSARFVDSFFFNYYSV